jgi:hypothetical protein
LSERTPDGGDDRRCPYNLWISAFLAHIAHKSPAFAGNLGFPPGFRIF